MVLHEGVFLHAMIAHGLCLNAVSDSRLLGAAGGIGAVREMPAILSFVHARRCVVAFTRPIMASYTLLTNTGDQRTVDPCRMVYKDDI